jgi:hypothetical protein
VTTLTNNASGGTNGVTVTTGNSGGASGNAFDGINAAFGGTVTFSNAETIHSTLSYNCDLPASAIAIMQWGASLGVPLSEVWFRMYGYVPTITTGYSNYIWNCSPVSGFGSSLILNTNGTFSFQDANGTNQITTTTAINAGAWFRVEGYVIGSTTAGQMNLQVFVANPDGVTPDENDTSGSAVNTGGAINVVQYGVTNQSGAGGAFQIYTIVGASTTGYLGPISSPAAPTVAYSMRMFP